MRILLADDDYNFAYVVKREIEEHDFIVDTVSNGVDAVLRVIEMSYDFILLDVKMPKLDGIDTLKILMRLKISNIINPRMQVIVFSGKSESALEECLASGAARFIKKPFNIEALIKFIQSISELLE